MSSGLEDLEYLLPPEITAAILSGGESRRMGQPKDTIVLWDGRPMIDHVRLTLKQIGLRTLVVKAPPPPEATQEPDSNIIYDTYPGLGPLAGIEAVLASGLGSGYLIAACDQPLLTPAILCTLLGGNLERACFYLATDGKTIHPFPGYYPAGVLPAVRAVLKSQRRSVRKLISLLEPAFLPLRAEDEYSIQSLNTPDDIALAARAYTT